MSIEYLQYVASKGRNNRRGKKGKRLTNLPYKDKDSSKHSSNPFRDNSGKYKTDRHEPGQNKKSVLVAESDPGILSIMKHYLNHLGYDYDAFNTGYEVLDFLYNSNTSKNKKYDIILLDTHLDKISGLAVANEIRKRNSYQRIMIMSTAAKEHLPPELIKSAKVHDADLFTKPFRLSELLCSLDH